jgi:septation ring formation regulator EzrA
MLYTRLLKRCSNLAPMSLLQLNNRIRDLCAKAVEAEQHELEPILEELKAALREHTSHLRELAAARLARKPA